MAASSVPDPRSAAYPRQCSALVISWDPTEQREKWANDGRRRHEGNGQVNLNLPRSSCGDSLGRTRQEELGPEALQLAQVVDRGFTFCHDDALWERCEAAASRNATSRSGDLRSR